MTSYIKICSKQWLVSTTPCLINSEFFVTNNFESILDSLDGDNKYNFYESLLNSYISTYSDTLLKIISKYEFHDGITDKEFYEFLGSEAMIIPFSRIVSSGEKNLYELSYALEESNINIIKDIAERVKEEILDTEIISGSNNFKNKIMAMYVKFIIK